MKPISRIAATAFMSGIALFACSEPRPVTPASKTPDPGALLPPPGPAWRVLETADGRSGQIEVLEHRGSLALAVDGVFQTVTPPAPGGIPRGLLLRGGDHIELIPWLRPAARTALLIGLGGGLHVRALEAYGIDVAAVEIEPEIARIARERFGIRSEVIAGDGREVLEREARRFDTVIIDAFSGAGLPERLFTPEAFEATGRLLGPEGVLAVHLIGRPDHPAVRAVARAIGAAFPRVLATRAGLADELGAIYIFASRSPLDLGPWTRAELEALGFSGREVISIDIAGAPLLSDADGGRLSAMARDIAEEHRRLSLEIRRSPPW